MADLSRVDSFFAFWEVELGRSGSEVRDLRGPGRLPATLGAPVGWEIEAAEEDSTLGSGVAVDDSGVDTRSPSFGGGRQRGHFLASGESSGTSTTSLAQ
jgi:hypothetical protein